MHRRCRVGNSLFRSLFFCSSLFALLLFTLWLSTLLLNIAFFKDMSDSLFCYKKRAIRSKIFVFFNMFLTVFTAFPLFMPKSASLPSFFAPSLFLKSDRSYSLLSLYKRVTVNKSLPPLYTKERL